MKVLGIESTAHTFGAGVVVNGEVKSNVREMYVPEKGGIHPREAADHHVRYGVNVVENALSNCGLERDDIDLVTFARGPGLGPCLRVGATIARALAVNLGVPILGVNHCVAHLEIGGSLGCKDPVLLYTSGANTQIIAFVRKRYRVLGETLDVGVGNMLDKLGREMGMGFPAGPRIEKLAQGEPVENVHSGFDGVPELVELPYSVKGMDVSFSGLMTAALSKWRRGASVPSICRSVQEYSFSMLCEVAERAMAHIGADELLLGGGVACNERLREMATDMVEARGGKCYYPPPSLSVDNGAMIAYLGELEYKAGVRQELDDTVIDQRFRTDQVEVVWREEREMKEIDTPGVKTMEIGGVPEEGAVIGRGAEAKITYLDYLSQPAVLKFRGVKNYRSREIDSMLISGRTRREAKMLHFLRESGVRTPVVLDADPERGMIILEYLPGPRLASRLNVLEPEVQENVVKRMGKIVGRMHSRGIIHGDLTTSNFILLDGSMDPELAVLDCSLAARTEEPEEKGVDLRLFFEVFGSTHGELMHLKDEFLGSYRSSNPGYAEVEEKLGQIESRARYMS